MSGDGNGEEKSPGEFHEASSMRKGVMTITVLAIATIVEYVVAVAVSRALVPLAIIAVVKGWFILDGFMHVKEMFSSEEESEKLPAELGASER